jgi:hypothetical protein
MFKQQLFPVLAFLSLLTLWSTLQPATPGFPGPFDCEF